jgi:glycerol-3-phosphate dehydrogenase
MADASLARVVRREVLPGAAALLIPRTTDGRVLFAVPWYGAVLLGTTDEPREDAPLDPHASEREIEFILATARGYLEDRLPRSSVLASFAGLRPLYSLAAAGSTASVSREHAVLSECGNLVSIVGGKWTTYRRMAADAMQAAERCGLRAPDADTAQLALVRDSVLENAADHADALAASADALARFIEHCERYTQARSAADVMSRRLRLGMTRGRVLSQ